MFSIPGILSNDVFSGQHSALAKNEDIKKIRLIKKTVYFETFLTIKVH